MTRGALKSEVERHISKNVIVIADSLNYIKGIYITQSILSFFLSFCITKAIVMSYFALLEPLLLHIALFTVTHHQKLHINGIHREKMRNGMRNCIYIVYTKQYTLTLDYRLDELIFRFEEPNDRRKWDDPCYIVEPEEDLPIQGIFEFLCSSKTTVIPNQATAYVCSLSRFDTHMVITNIFIVQNGRYKLLVRY